MFEKYSERSRRVIFLARLKAEQRGAQSIEINDLLAAIVTEDQGGFENPGAKGPDSGYRVVQGNPSEPTPFLPSAFAKELLARLESENPPSQPLPNSAEIQVSEGVERILSQAAALRDELRQNQIEPLHLLAAILEDESGMASQTLRYAGITREKIVLHLEGL